MFGSEETPGTSKIEATEHQKADSVQMDTGNDLSVTDHSVQDVRKLEEEAVLSETSEHLTDSEEVRVQKHKKVKVCEEISSVEMVSSVVVQNESASKSTAEDPSMTVPPAGVTATTSATVALPPLTVPAAKGAATLRTRKPSSAAAKRVTDSCQVVISHCVRADNSDASYDPVPVNQAQDAMMYLIACCNTGVKNAKEMVTVGVPVHLVKFVEETVKLERIQTDERALCVTSLKLLNNLVCHKAVFESVMVSAPGLISVMVAVLSATAHGDTLYQCLWLLLNVSLSKKHLSSVLSAGILYSLFDIKECQPPSSTTQYNLMEVSIRLMSVIAASEDIHHPDYSDRLVELMPTLASMLPVFFGTDLVHFKCLCEVFTQLTFNVVDEVVDGPVYASIVMTPGLVESLVKLAASTNASPHHLKSIMNVMQNICDGPMDQKTFLINAGILSTFANIFKMMAKTTTEATQIELYQCCASGAMMGICGGDEDVIRLVLDDDSDLLSVLIGVADDADAALSKRVRSNALLAVMYALHGADKACVDRLVEDMGALDPVLGLLQCVCLNDGCEATVSTDDACEALECLVVVLQHFDETQEVLNAFLDSLGTWVWDVIGQLRKSNRERVRDSATEVSDCLAEIKRQCSSSEEERK